MINLRQMIWFNHLIALSSIPPKNMADFFLTLVVRCFALKGIQHVTVYILDKGFD